MGNGSSAGKADIKFNDRHLAQRDEIFALADTEKIVKLAHSRWKKPFNLDAEVNEGLLFNTKELWLKLLAGTISSKTYVARKHGDETFLEFFIRKLYTGLTESDRSFYSIYPEDPKIQMKLVKVMMDSIFYFASDGHVTVKERERASTSSFSGVSCTSNIPNELSVSEDNDLENVVRTKLYHVVRAHFIRGMNHRQYITMCSGLMDNFKLCFGDSFTEQHKKEWVTLFSCLLKKLIPVTIAYEVLNSSSDPFEGSSSISIQEEDEHYVLRSSVSQSGGYSMNEEAMLVGASIREELAAPSGRYEDL